MSIWEERFNVNDLAELSIDRKVVIEMTEFSAAMLILLSNIGSAAFKGNIKAYYSNCHVLDFYLSKYDTPEVRESVANNDAMLSLLLLRLMGTSVSSQEVQDRYKKERKDDPT